MSPEFSEFIFFPVPIKAFNCKHMDNCNNYFPALFPLAVRAKQVLSDCDVDGKFSMKSSGLSLQKVHFSDENEEGK